MLSNSRQAQQHLTCLLTVPCAQVQLPSIIVLQQSKVARHETVIGVYALAHCNSLQDKPISAGEFRVMCGCDVSAFGSAIMTLELPDSAVRGSSTKGLWQHVVHHAKHVQAFAEAGSQLAGCWGRCRPCRAVQIASLLFECMQQVNSSRKSGTFCRWLPAHPAGSDDHMSQHSKDSQMTESAKCSREAFCGGGGGGAGSRLATHPSIF